MNKILTVLLIVVALACFVYAKPSGQVRMNDNVAIVDEDLSGPVSNIVFFAQGGGIASASIPLSNFVWQAGITNMSQLSAFVGSKNQPDGYAGLDENGKLSTNAIPYIIVTFTGGTYEQ